MHQPLPPRERLRQLGRRVSRFRRWLAAALVALAGALGLNAVEPAPAPTVEVLVASRDLPAGRTLEAGDLRPQAMSPEAVPAGAFRRDGSRPNGPPASGIGRVLSGPLRSGEPVTDVRLVGPALFSSYGKSRVGAPVRVADAEVLSLVRPGDLVDVLAASTDAATASSPAEVIAYGATVVALPGAPSSSSEGGAMLSVPGDGGLVLLAVSASTAADLARAAVTSRLSLVLRGP